MKKEGSDHELQKNMTDSDQLLMDNPIPQLSADDQTSLNQILKNGVLTRRQAMKWLMAMGVSAFASNILVSQIGEVYAATPKRGARLRVAMHSQSAKDTLDPAKFSFSSDFIRGTSFYNSLTRLDNNGQALPELAESFEPNSNATEWIFKLRKGVTFHDGKTLDADDVIYSIMRHKDPNTGSAAKSLADLTEDVKSDGKDTVVVKLAGPNADLPILLSTFHFMIIKKGTTDFSTAIGTGPFKVKEFKPGVRTVGVRNENYFKEGRPYMEEHEFFGISNDAARLNALLSGDVHMMSSLNVNSFKDIEPRKNVEIFSTPASRFSQVIMMVDRSPTNNIDLRMAVKNLFDREKVLKSIMKNYGQIGNDHVIPPSSPLYNNNLPQRGLDRDKAKYHLKKAGMENARLELHVSPAANLSVELGLVLQREAARVGLTLDLKREPADILVKYLEKLQRLMAAMAMCCGPEMLVFDEPTTALDVTTQINVLKSFKEAIQRQNVAAIYVTHDLAVVAQIADRIIVLFNGEIQEQGTTKDIINQPQHEYTRILMAASDPDTARQDAARSQNSGKRSETRDPLIDVHNVTAGYGGTNREGLPRIPILKDINLSVGRSSVVGVIGESGSGKTTLGHVIAGLLPLARGEISLDGTPLKPSVNERSRDELQNIQMVFQMADTALNPSHTIGKILGRPIEYFQGLTGRKKKDKVAELLEMVKLPPHFGSRKPEELSGGQKQRINLARAFAADPKIVICDEVTSGLDTVVRMAIIDLIKELHNDLGISFLFISHDISTIASLAEEVVVMYQGRIVESGDIDQILKRPEKPYTQILMASVPHLRMGWLDEAIKERNGVLQSAEDLVLAD